MQHPKRQILLACAFAAALAAAPAAYAETPWQQSHPARTVDNDRLRTQNARIHNEVRDGQITRGQAAALHNEDHQIRQEERDMAGQRPGGHLSASEQQVIRQQENGVSRQIGR